MKKLGIIIPVFETSVWKLRRCLSSINQASLLSGFSNYSVVVVDDGTVSGLSESYKDLIKEYQHTVRLIRLPSNSGIGGARNAGAGFLDDCEYLTFIDSDDVIFGSFFSKLCCHLAPKTLTVGNLIKRTPAHTKRYRKSELLGIVSRGASSLQSPIYYMNLLSVPVIFPSAVFWQCNGYRENIFSGEHLDLYIRILSAGAVEQIVYVPEVLYCYFSTPEGQTLNDVSKHIQGKADIVKMHLFNRGLDLDSIVTFPSYQGLPAIYLPKKNGNLLLDLEWVRFSEDNARWGLSEECVSDMRTSLFYDRSSGIYVYPLQYDSLSQSSGYESQNKASRYSN